MLTIPRWRGFNLPDLVERVPGGSFRESDFEWMAQWGFDFARLPLSYWNWSDPQNPMEIEESALRPIDDAVRWGKEYGIHVNLCFHRIPGYCVNHGDLEPFQLFDTEARERVRALTVAEHHWRWFAQRYRGIPPSRLSFDLLNEPPWMPGASHYEPVVRALVAAIRAEDPERLIFADGINIGQTPVPSLADLNVAQSTRGYLPKSLSHYTADWVPKEEFESSGVPRWPLIDRRKTVWDKERLRRDLIAPWLKLAELGIPVHVGEWGCYSLTPHHIAMAWMADYLSLWKEAGWGWALWNLRGPFGVVDSGRHDIRYEPFRGHQLDRRMLELLRAG